MDFVSIILYDIGVFFGASKGFDRDLESGEASRREGVTFQTLNINADDYELALAA